MKRKISKVFLLCALTTLISCGGDSGSTPSGLPDEDSPSSGSCSSVLSGLTSGDSSSSYTSTGVLSSITQTESCTSKVAANAISLKREAIVPSEDWNTEAWAKYDDAIASAQNEEEFPDCAAYIFEPSPGEDPACFGPEIKYQFHLDGDVRSGGEGDVNCDDEICAFPVGDLGIWTANEAQTDEACAAAKMNSDIKYVSGFTNMAKNVHAIVECLANRATDPVTRPTDETGVTITTQVNQAVLNEKIEFSEVKWSKVSDSYVIKLTGDSSQGTDGIVFISTVVPTEKNIGFEVNQIYGYFGAGNDEGLKVVKNGALAFSLYAAKDPASGNSNMKFISAMYDSTPIVDDDSSPDYILDVNKMIALDSSWSMDHRTILLNDDGSSDKLMKYSWIAGNEAPSLRAPDNYSRTFMAMVNQEETEGVAYYGYGHKDAGRLSISNFICNWTGPNNSQDTLRGVDLAQKQTMTKASANALWVTTEELSEITYAPVRSCTSDNDGIAGIDTRALGEDSEGAPNGSKPAATSPMDWGYTDSLGEATAITAHELVDLSAGDDATNMLSFQGMVDPTAL